MKLDLLTSVLILGALAVLITISIQLLVEENVSLPDSRTIKDWKTLVEDEEQDNVIVEFFDYECQACHFQNIQFKKLKKSKSDINIVYKHYPKGGYNSTLKSITAECARKFNNFNKVHDILFTIDNFDIATVIKEANIQNIDAFKKCFVNRETQNIISQHLIEGERLKIRGVPSLIIKGELYIGALSDKQLKHILN